MRIERTLAAARRRLLELLDDGSLCPCCGQWAKRYRRALNSTMVRSLLWLVQASRRDVELGGSGWIDVPADAPKWVTKTNQHATLRWWGLAERLPSDVPAKKHSGVWRPTRLGRRFVDGEALVPSHLLHYNNEVVGDPSAKSIGVMEALDGGGFDYEETMNGVMAGWL
jgi:hypothetical protein